MAEVTIELIEALLCPSTNRNAEREYKSIAISTRVQSLSSILQSLASLTSTPTPSNATSLSSSAVTTLSSPTAMLTAVLLRREISSLGGYCNIKKVKLNSEWEIVRMLGEVITPLLNIFDQCKNIDCNAFRRQIGFAIAEVCSSLTIMDDNFAIEVMNAILEQIAADVSVIKFFSIYVNMFSVSQVYS